MENASDALMMAFGVLIFVLALTVAINAFSQAREVSETVLYTADETNFYEYEEEVTSGASQNRIVGLETIIPTLYKYYKENYTVLFREGYGYDEETGLFDSVDVLELYKSPSKLENGNLRVWRINDNKYWSKIKTKYERFFSSTHFDTDNPGEKLREIFSFDLEEEQNRNEPWTISNAEIKKNLDCFIYGGTEECTYHIPSDGSDYIKYSGFINDYSNRKFVENIAEIKYTPDTETNDEIYVDTSRTNKGKKRIYIFTLIKSVKEE